MGLERTIQPCLRRLFRPTTVLRVHQQRHSSTQPPTAALPSRWLSDVQSRIGRCVTFGMSAPQVNEASTILNAVAKDWRELMAGSEGFLTTPDRRGLYRHTVVWGDMDSMGHVNNCTYNKWAESGRCVWGRRFAALYPENAEAWIDIFTPRGQGLILRSIRTDFKFPMTWPDHVTVYHKLGTEPTAATDSFTLDVLILSELQRRPAARCVEDVVVYDYRKAAKVPLLPFMASPLEETWRLQEEAKRVNSARVQDILGRVRALELQTWDRPDAVEDHGSAAR